MTIYTISLHDALPIFDEVQRPAGRRVVGIGHPARPVRPPHDLVITDDRFSDPAQKWTVGRLNVAVHRPIIGPRSASTLSWLDRKSTRLNSSHPSISYA